MTIPNLPPAATATLAAWHKMAAAKDFTDLASISAPDVLFRSPAFFKPYAGKDAFSLVISTVITIFEDFQYHRSFVTPDSQSVVLEFSARIGDSQLKGIDMIRFAENGQIAEFEVMIRPANALLTLGKLMSERAGPTLKDMR